MAKNPEKTALSELPRNWRTAVLLIGTHGLSVFLVLYWVFGLGPQFADLKATVDRTRERCSLSDKSLAQFRELLDTSVPVGMAASLLSELDELAKHAVAPRSNEEEVRLRAAVANTVAQAFEKQVRGLADFVSVCYGSAVVDALRGETDAQAIAGRVTDLLMPGFDKPEQGFKFDRDRLVHLCKMGIQGLGTG